MCVCVRSCLWYYFCVACVWVAVLCIFVGTSEWVDKCTHCNVFLCVTLSLSVQKHLLALPSLVLNVRWLNLTFQHCPKVQTGKRSWKPGHRSILSIPLYGVFHLTLSYKENNLTSTTMKVSLLKTAPDHKKYNEVRANSFMQPLLC